MRNKLVYLFSIFAIAFFWLTACKTSDSYRAKTNSNKSEVVLIKAEGYAQITEAGEQDAYDRALKHGFRKAVEKALGTLVQSKAIVENSTLIKDKIIAKSEGFVKRYKVLSEKNRGETKYLKLDVWVTKEDIEKDVFALSILNDDVGRPTLFVVIDERKMNGKSSEIGKNYLYDFFQKKRFRFVDVPASLISGKNKNNVEARISDWGSRNGAQILIIGNVQSEEQQVGYFQDTGFKSVKSKIIIRAIYAGNGEVIASKTVSAAAAAPNLQVAQNNSIEKALGKVSPELFKAIIEHWKEASSEGFEYEIVVSGLSFLEAKLIKDAIESMVEGIKKVFEKNYRNGEMNYLVRYTGLASQLAGMLILEKKTQVPLKLVELDNKRLKFRKK